MEIGEGSEIGREAQQGRGSRRVAAVNIGPDHHTTHVDSKENKLDNQDDPLKEPGWKRFIAHVGPGFLVSLAYLDPGNWRHLAELCKSEYPKYVKLCLWLLAEVAVIAADIPEVIGTAFALNILFHIPVWSGVLITGLSTLLLLGLQRYGVRKLELVISILVFVMAACYFGEMSYVKPPAAEVVKGLFIPKLNGNSATADAIALLGALVMPYFLLESGFALFVALLINIAVVSVSGAVCSSNTLSAEDSDRCGDLTLNSASFLLKNVLGRSSSAVYAIALLASGQSSTITGTYAGQFIMQGFLDLKMKKWLRNLMTRCIAITPSLIVSLIGGSSGAGRLIIIASMILSFELPFALIPLLKFSSSRTKMGPHKNSIYDLPVGSLVCAVPNGPVVVNIPTLGMSIPHGIPFWPPNPARRAYVAMAYLRSAGLWGATPQAYGNEHNSKKA
uniref:Metal transporter Nramp5-like n=1 Tax=Ananas comosus var. bracteatus TaxID=296719 RepID=A0A6V7NHQ2_ANACO|nr:unnamed protein product [Ananas comosus var. bracteatus]